MGRITPSDNHFTSLNSKNFQTEKPPVSLGVGGGGRRLQRQAAAPHLREHGGALRQPVLARGVRRRGPESDAERERRGGRGSLGAAEAQDDLLAVLR